MEKETRAGGLKLRGWVLNAILALMVFAVNARLNAAMDDALRPRFATSWLGTNDPDVEGAIPPDMLVVRVTHDEGWSAYQNAQPQEVERYKMRFMVVHAESGGRVEAA